MKYGFQSIFLLCCTVMLGACATTALNNDTAPSKAIGQYLDHGNGTVTDTKTRLMWKKSIEGADINPLLGLGYKWDTAVKVAADAKFAGYDDWRLPTVDELRSLVQCRNGKVLKTNAECEEGCQGKNKTYGNDEKQEINQVAFPDLVGGGQRPWLWSSTPGAVDSEMQYISFRHGITESIQKFDGNGRIRLVRDAK